MKLSEVMGSDSPSPTTQPPRLSQVMSPPKVYYNDAGQPFTTTGAPPPPAAQQDAGYTGSILPLRRDDSGLHLAIPESVAAPVRGAEQGGERLLGVGEQGKNPLRPLSPDTMAAVAAVGGAGDLRASPGSAAAAAVPATALPASGISQERALLAREARNVFKIPVTAPQIGMSSMGRIADKAVRDLPLSGARAHEMETRQAFNAAVAKTFGEDAKTITQSVMDRAKRRIGGTINRIEDAAEVKLDSQFVNHLAGIESAARAGLTDPEYGVIRRALEGVIRNVLAGDKLEGTTYGNLLHRNAPIDQLAGNANPNIARVGSEIKSALQDALERSLSGKDLDEYRNARFQYKNMKTVEPLVNKSPTGDISPALLNGRVSQQFPNRAYDTSGKNPLDRLAKIGQAFLKEPGTSTTAERATAYYGLGKAAELAGAVAAGDILGIPTTLGTMGGTLLGGRLVSKALRSPARAERTINRALAPRRPPPPPSVSPGISSYVTRGLPGVVAGEDQENEQGIAPLVRRPPASLYGEQQ